MEFMARMRMLEVGLGRVTCRSCAYDPMMLLMPPKYILPYLLHSSGAIQALLIKSICAQAGPSAIR
jgi:hypothetical protein